MKRYQVTRNGITTDRQLGNVMQ